MHFQLRSSAEPPVLKCKGAHNGKLWNALPRDQKILRNSLPLTGKTKPDFAGWQKGLIEF
jgi:hypothetical protein